MYGYKHPNVVCADGKARVLNARTNQVYTFDDITHRLKLEEDKKIIKEILEGESTPRVD